MLIIVVVLIVVIVIVAVIVILRRSSGPVIDKPSMAWKLLASLSVFYTVACQTSHQACADLCHVPSSRTLIQLNKSGAVTHKRIHLYQDGHGANETESALESIQVVCVIMTAPGGFEKRMMLRNTLSQLTSGVSFGGHQVDVKVLFSVGNSYPCQTQAEQVYWTDMLAAEARQYGDLAIVNISDSCLPDQPASSLFTHFKMRCGSGQ